MFLLLKVCQEILTITTSLLVITHILDISQTNRTEGFHVQLSVQLEYCMQTFKIFKCIVTIFVRCLFVSVWGCDGD